MKDKHPDWMILQVQTNSFIITPCNEWHFKQYMFEFYPADTIVRVFDYDTEKLLEELPLNSLYEEPKA